MQTAAVSTSAPPARLEEIFRVAYGGLPHLCAQAPGRVNLIGEHTDYNDGFVLPCAIGFRTWVAARARTDTQVRVVAADFDAQQDVFELTAPIAKHPAFGWANYVRGVVHEMRRHVDLPHGINLAIAGDVPRGAGLSSSASLEVALAQALKQAYGLEDLCGSDLAGIAQRAENDFVGCNCGIMDQMVSACAIASHAMLLDCRSLQTRAVPMDPGLGVVVVHSGVNRGLVDSAYNARRAQCESAAQALGVVALRDADPAMLERAGDALDPVVLRRARHVISENVRTVEAAECLWRGDVRGLGRRMQASHCSMRDDFEITVPAIDQLVMIAEEAIAGEGGARMTGGGFGGCVVAVLPRARIPRLCESIDRHYRSPMGKQATIHVCEAVHGAGPC